MDRYKWKILKKISGTFVDGINKLCEFQEF